MRPEKVIKKDPDSKYTELGIPQDWVAVIQKAGYNLVEEMKELGIVDARAAENADIVPDVAPIRGGTDGARLSFKGLPCPNLGTGGYAFHGVYEHITVEGMDKVVVMVKDIVGMFAK